MMGGRPSMEKSTGNGEVSDSSKTLICNLNISPALEIHSLFHHGEEAFMSIWEESCTKLCRFACIKAFFYIVMNN